MVENRFNPADFPYLVIAQPLTPCVTNLQTDEDEDVGMMLKALVINYKDWVKFEKGSVIQLNIDAVMYRSLDYQVTAFVYKQRQLRLRRTCLVYPLFASIQRSCHNRLVATAAG